MKTEIRRGITEKNTLQGGTWTTSLTVPSIFFFSIDQRQILFFLQRNFFVLDVGLFM
jgi:hypothetical protein